MRNLIYGLKDVKIGEYVRIYVEDNHVEAQRQMQYAVMQQDNKIATYPADFEIHYLGEVDPVTGNIKSVPPECIINGIQARNAAIERIKAMSPSPDHQQNVHQLVERLEQGIKGQRKK